jgi:hypothetical protein
MAISPKDEYNARIQERQRALEVEDAQLQVEQTYISLLRQMGELEN